MKLRTIDIIILLSLGLLLITRATWGLYKDVNIDISKARSISGKVVYAEIKEIEKFTLKIKKYSTVFAIRLENSNQHFAIDRGARAYNYLDSKIKVGDTINILYRSSTSDNNTNVFQIKKNGEILADMSEYKKKESRMISFAFLLGAILIGGTIFWHIKRKQKHDELKFKVARQHKKTDSLTITHQ